jgi:hypothetical protein
MMKLKMVSWAGHVARLGVKVVLEGFWFENLKKGEKKEHLDAGRKIILKLILEK